MSVTPTVAMGAELPARELMGLRARPGFDRCQGKVGKRYLASSASNIYKYDDHQ